MKISTKLVLAAAVPAFMTVVIAVGIGVIMLPTGTLQFQQDEVSKVAADISELRDLARSYVSTHERRPLMQYLALTETLYGDIDAACEPDTVYVDDLRRIEQDARLAHDTFTLVRDNYDRRSAVSTSVYREAEARLTGQLFARLRGMNRDSAALMQTIGDDIVNTQRRVYYAVAALVIVAAAILTWILVVLRRGIMTSLRMLQRGTESIAAGQFDHRIGLRGRDELSDLGRSFDHMSGRLHEITASRDELETEVGERKRLQRQLTQELHTTRTLLDAAASFSTWTDLPGLLRELAAAIGRLTGESRVTLSTWDSGEGVLLVVVSEGQLLDPPVALPLGGLSRELRFAVRGKHSSVSESGEPALDTAMGAPPSKRMVHVPMVYRDVVVGVISIGANDEGPHLSQREIALIEGIASQAAAALENARLYVNEHRVAETLQEALLALPEHLPGVDFAHAYRSATEAARVGGDFYDLFEISDGVFGVTIGDVAGKGLDAAVLTSLVKTAIRIHAHDKGAAPEVVLRHTNDVIYRSTMPSAYVTVLFAVLDVANGTIAFANAGHTTGAIVGAHGVVGTLPPTGPILGAFAEIDIDAGSVVLEPDQVLFLYTDGLTEARRMGELFGEGRLMELLGTLGDETPTQVVLGVIETVLRFAGGGLNDDLALMAVGLRDSDADEPRNDRSSDF